MSDLNEVKSIEQPKFYETRREPDFQVRVLGAANKDK